MAVCATLYGQMHLVYEALRERKIMLQNAPHLVHPLPFIGGNCILQIMGSLVFLFAAGGNVPLLFLGILLFGAGIGNNTSLPPLIAQAEFNKADVSRVVRSLSQLAKGLMRSRPLRSALFEP